MQLIAFGQTRGFAPGHAVAAARIAIDIVLGGDNAVVIAMASRRLPEKQRNRAIFWGVFGAIGIRVVLIFFAAHSVAALAVLRSREAIPVMIARLKTEEGRKKVEDLLDGMIWGDFV